MTIILIAIPLVIFLFVFYKFTKRSPDAKPTDAGTGGGAPGGNSGAGENQA